MASIAFKEPKKIGSLQTAYEGSRPAGITWAFFLISTCVKRSRSPNNCIEYP